MIKLIIYGAIVCIIGYFAISANSLWVNNDKLKVQIEDTTAALRVERGKVYGLKDTVSGLRIANGNLRAENSDLKAQNDRVKADALLAASKLSETNARLRSTAQTLSAIQAKQEADALYGGIGAINTTVNDSTLNREVAALKSQIRHYEEVVIPGLQQTIARLSDEKLGLERELNGDAGAKAQVLQAQKQLADARSFVQAKRSEAKGLFSGKRRRVLAEVDTQLQTIQSQ